VNQIDHICISRRWASSLQDVRVYRGADVASDHHLLVTDMKMKLKAKSSPTGNTVHNAYNVEQLKVDETSEAYNVALENKFEVLQAAGNVEESWMLFRNAVNETADSVLGKRRGKRKERWISSSTWKIIDERRDLKAQKEQILTEGKNATAITMQYKEKKIKKSRNAARMTKRSGLITKL